MTAEIGQRVTELMASSSTRFTQKELAELVGMTPDAFSRAVNGKRAFSALEIAQIAEALGGDVHWLITGDRDPHRVLVAARHDFDAQSRQRSIAGYSTDRDTVDAVALAYQQAYVDSNVEPSSLPGTPSDVREHLGADFVRPFIGRLEERLGIDVVRVAGLSTSYCIDIAGRRVILIAATGNWFWENWSIAHELGHIAGDHQFRDAHPSDADEGAANAFAAELLLPAEQMASQNWLGLTASELAQRVWELGVSTDALARRLRSLRIDTCDLIDSWASQPTQRLLRHHWRGNVGGADQITTRMDEASARRFPLPLQDAHLAKIASGDLGKETLAWMLGIDADDLEVDAPQSDEIEAEHLAKALEL